MPSTFPTLLFASISLSSAASLAMSIQQLEPLVHRGDSVSVNVTCAGLPSSFPTWQQLPTQTTLPDPFLPLKYTTTDNAGSASAASFAQSVMTGQGAHRIQTKEEWYTCRQPEILTFLQEYQYGYYPDHSQEKVEATRSGTSVSISVTAGGKTGKFKATISLPSGASASKPAPVVINIGGMQNQPYLSAGIAIAQFDYTSVAADSNSKTGAVSYPLDRTVCRSPPLIAQFWDIYKGRDIGKTVPWDTTLKKLY
jgi:hypothetical protein